MAEDDSSLDLSAQHSGVFAAAPPPPSSNATTVSPGLYTIPIPIQPLTRDMEQRALPKMAIYIGALGALVILAGVAALLNPILFGISLELFLGWLLATGGVFHLVSGIMLWSAPGAIPHVVVGIIHTVFGIWLITHPKEG